MGGHGTAGCDSVRGNQLIMTLKPPSLAAQIREVLGTQTDRDLTGPEVLKVIENEFVHQKINRRSFDVALSKARKDLRAKGPIFNIAGLLSNPDPLTMKRLMLANALLDLCNDVEEAYGILKAAKTMSDVAKKTAKQ